MWFFSFGKRNTAKLLATGQLTSYGSGDGVDDGALKKGIVKRYTILTTGQYSGNTNITINSKTDVHSNNCVFDDNTGLTWSRYLSASVGPASDGKIPWTTNGSGEGIFAYAVAANAGTMAGYTDWRVPNLFEMSSLIDLEAPTGYPDVTAFPIWGALYTWMSITMPGNVANAMILRIGDILFTSNVKTGNFNVVLVRGG
jgi:hypothetical protein